jgi:hypothetical protein
MKVWTEAELIDLERDLRYCGEDAREQLRHLIAIARAHGYVLPIPPMPPRKAGPEPVLSLQPNNQREPPKGWKRR